VEGKPLARNVFSSSAVAKAAATATTIIICFGLLFAGVRAIAQSESRTISKPGNLTTAGNLAVVEADLRDKTIQFGDQLDVLITLQNQGKEPITIRPGALVLENRGWSGYPGFGSGLGESILVRAGMHAKEAFTLQPGESVVLTGSNVEMATQSMGPMTAAFDIDAENETLRRQIGNEARFTVSYYVVPSKLMLSAWAARTSAERQRLQPEMRELLLLGSKAEEWRDRNYVEGTLKFMGCYALPLLDSAMRDSDSVVRRQAVLALSQSAWAAGNLNSFIAHLMEKKEGRDWAALVGRCDEKHAVRESIRLAIAGVSDPEPAVRIAAISVLTDRAALESNLRRSMANDPRPRESMDERAKRMYESVGLVDPAIPLVQKMAADADPGVRSEAQKFLSNFASQRGVAGGVATSLADPDVKVRGQALQALKSSHEPPPMATLEKAFASAEGEVALGLIELMYEREDAELAARLSPRFKERSGDARLMILTAIAGHPDAAALELVAAGLKDGDIRVRRAALMRLPVFPRDKAISQLNANSANLSHDLAELRSAVQKELASRELFPFLSRGDGWARESAFPSIEGTGPVVSPNGEWVAYVETGWGRPGGSGGMGRSNLLSIAHVVRRDGYLDRIVSDMFLVGWMSDSRRLASARDGFAAIVNLNGKVVAEFGDRLETPYKGGGIGGGNWPAGDPRHQFGARMPHSKRFQIGEDSEGRFDFDYGEDAAVSPDGKWFGPRRVKDQWQFLDVEGNKIELKAPEGSSFRSSQAIWSPDGAHVVVVPVQSSGSFGRSQAVEPGKTFVIDFAGPMLKATIDVDQVWGMGAWSYRKGRWNPWSTDGKHLAFIRKGQVWVSDPNGNATQVTFDASNKVFPTFSPDGTKIAYITWQFDNREHYTRLGPTDIWVVDIKTGLSARVTRADPGRIGGLDWLDNGTIIFDRLDSSDRHSTLRTISLR
jgi:HEAT repeat protein